MTLPFETICDEVESSTVSGKSRGKIQGCFTTDQAKKTHLLNTAETPSNSAGSKFKEVNLGCCWARLVIDRCINSGGTNSARKEHLLADIDAHLRSS